MRRGVAMEGWAVLCRSAQGCRRPTRSTRRSDVPWRGREASHQTCCSQRHSVLRLMSSARAAGVGADNAGESVSQRGGVATSPVGVNSRMSRMPDFATPTPPLASLATLHGRAELVASAGSVVESAETPRSQCTGAALAAGFMLHRQSKAASPGTVSARRGARAAVQRLGVL